MSLISLKGVLMYHYVAAALVVCLAGCQSSGDNPVTLSTQKDKVSYSIGLSVGKNLSKDSIAIDPQAFLRGVLDAAADTSTWLMSENQIQDCMIAFQDSLRTVQMERSRVAAEKNQREADAFMAANGQKPGIVTLPSGLQYRIISDGNGKKPSASSTVSVHYRGTLIDGKEFDSSVKRGQPATFQVNGVIRGWTEALQLMKEGSKWELFIPPALAYGESGAGGVIPPSAALIFEVELLSVK
jgi:FKBP-type peptidyl-prolyl cis-trans isomerase FklB